ncbi:MAG: DNA polymerase III subunit alpha [Phycisphaerales bacterium]|nr:DNA polymerase III subunit alpha [Phycisphaerales bacterium]MBT7171121.1 DNA polymerase III subunit alpha [Phycisphaerales bacterium]
MANDGFVHLHTHSHYSLLDGGATVGAMADAIIAGGMNAFALTDHGNMFGAVDHYNTCRDKGIKPILGFEAYISPTTRDDRSMGQRSGSSYHMVLLAQNAAGWLNLKKLCSYGYMEGFYYVPRIDRDLLSQYSEGIICSTACLGGEVPNALIAGDYDKAKRIAGEYLDIFGRDNFYIEVQNHGIADQTRINPDLVRLASELDVGLIGTNDAHFLRREDKPAHQVLTCVSMQKQLEDVKAEIRANPDREHYPEVLYLRSAEEMREVFKEFPGACDNTLKIAEMCNVEIDFSKEYLPNFPLPDDFLADKPHLAELTERSKASYEVHGDRSKSGELQDDDLYLRDLAEAGLVERFADREIPQEYRDRLNRELTVIADKGYSSYFLVVYDFVKFARENSIPSAPRGSGVATLLGYCLRIAEVDPLQYGLLFERFTDPERAEAPDIDIDLCQNGRQDVIDYVREKYGHVAQIITYGSLKAKAVLKDVGRVLGFEPKDMDAITKLVPDGPKVTLAKALKSEPDLARMKDSDPRVEELFDYAAKLEGLYRHTGIHAAGVIVADVPLETVVPLCVANRDGLDKKEYVTQWDGPTSEKAGLMKMDFLGLRTLTILQRCRELVEARTGEDRDPELFPLDDDGVYALFRNGYTDGVFQFESDGMKGILSQMKPQRLSDLIAANAMYRPGPMEFIPDYCKRKDGIEEIPSLHESVDGLLAETYGIMAYQEQVMQVLNILGKLPLNKALTLIKAISKKKLKTIASEKENFLNGAEENGISRDDGEELFAKIEKFAGYGFNKAHSTRYAMVAYQGAYFKYYYPREFLAATLTFECGDTTKVVQYMAEAKRMGVAVLPPNINTCGHDFVVDGEAVRFGLSAVKGVGDSAIEAIVAAREEVGQFTDLYHFCEFVDLRSVNRSAIEALIKCGGFDALGSNRAAMMAAVDKAIDLGNQAAKDRKSGQMSFFGDSGMLGGGGGGEPVRPSFPNVQPWSEGELLQAEKETLGFFVSSHPLVKYGQIINYLNWPPRTDFGLFMREPERFPQDTQVRIGCMVAAMRPVFTKKKGEKMAMLTLEDTAGKHEAVCFPRTYKQISDLLEKDTMIFVTGSIDRSRDKGQIIVDAAVAIDEGAAKYAAECAIFLPPAADETLTAALRDTLAANPGHVPIKLFIQPSCNLSAVASVQIDKGGIMPSVELLEDIETVLESPTAVRFLPKRPEPKKRMPWENKKPSGAGAR